MRIALEQDEQNRIISNPAVNVKKKQLYSTALKQAKAFFEPDRGKILLYDPPERELEYHTMIVQLLKEDFFDDEVTVLSDIIRAFDGVRIIGDTKQNVTLEFLIDGIYTNNTTNSKKKPE